MKHARIEVVISWFARRVIDWITYFALFDMFIIRSKCRDVKNGEIV